MSSSVYSLAAIRSIIAQNLGAGRVSVELMAEHYNRGIDAALKLLCRYRPEYGYQTLPVTIGGNRYTLTAKHVTGVLDATFWHGGRRFEEAPYYVRWIDRSMELADMKDTQRVFGDTPDWHAQEDYDEVTGELVWHIYAQFTRSSFLDTFARLPSFMNVQFTWAIQNSDDRQFGVARIRGDMRQWVESYATAFCRQILGDIRGKFGGIPGAGDGSITPNDGGSQVQRAIQDMARLEQDLQRRARQLPLMID